MFKRKYSVTIIDENRNVVHLALLKSLPRRDEFIYLESHGKYFKVLNIIHYLTEKQGVYVVVKLMENNILNEM